MIQRFRRRSRPLLIGRTGRSAAAPVVGLRFAGLPDTFSADFGGVGFARRVAASDSDLTFDAFVCLIAGFRIASVAGSASAGV